MIVSNFPRLNSRTLFSWLITVDMTNLIWTLSQMSWWYEILSTTFGPRTTFLNQKSPNDYYSGLVTNFLWLLWESNFTVKFIRFECKKFWDGFGILSLSFLILYFALLLSVCKTFDLSYTSLSFTQYFWFCHLRFWSHLSRPLVTQWVGV